MAPSEHDNGSGSQADGEIYWSSPIGGETPPELSTGNPDDDQILRQIAARTSLDRPRNWEHFLLVPDESAARLVANPLADCGWDVVIVPPGEDDSRWTVVAEGQDVVLTAPLVRSTRELFENLAAQLPGSEYDGWQASIDFDEIFEAMTSAPDLRED
jgi:hypothetical protein